MRGRSRAVAVCVLAVLAGGATAGCGDASGKLASGGAKGSSPGASTTRPATPCGTVRTAAGVPVNVEVEGGQASCGTARAIERAYSRDLAGGHVPGNGGGAPVTIHGWVCQGYATPQVLATGRASACHKDGTQILAVLPAPTTASPSPTSS